MTTTSDAASHVARAPRTETRYATAPAGSVAELVKKGAGRRAIADLLDSLSPSGRVEQMLAIQHGLVGKLYDQVGGNEPLTLEDIVPAGETGTVILEGRNSLPTFSRFQKRFMRMGDEIVGYNHQLMSFVTGPGYFVTRPPTRGEAKPDELFFDYTTDPKSTPVGWPPFRASDRGMGRLVWMNMKDFCRRVATGVLVGKAYKKGVAMNAHFTLTKPY